MVGEVAADTWWPYLERFKVNGAFVPDFAVAPSLMTGLRQKVLVSNDNTYTLFNVYPNRGCSVLGAHSYAIDDVPTPVENEQECATLCANNKVCISYTFVHPFRTCSLSYYCREEESLSSAATSFGVKNEQVMQTYSVSTGGKFSVGVGNTIAYNNHRTTSLSLEECKLICAMDISCLGFDLDTEDPTDCTFVNFKGHSTIAGHPNYRIYWKIPRHPTLCGGDPNLLTVEEKGVVEDWTRVQFGTSVIYNFWSRYRDNSEGKPFITGFTKARISPAGPMWNGFNNPQKGENRVIFDSWFDTGTLQAPHHKNPDACAEKCNRMMSCEFWQHDRDFNGKPVCFLFRCKREWHYNTKNEEPSLNPEEWAADERNNDFSIDQDTGRPMCGGEIMTQNWFINGFAQDKITTGVIDRSVSYARYTTNGDGEKTAPQIGAANGWQLCYSAGQRRPTTGPVAGWDFETQRDDNWVFNPTTWIANCGGENAGPSIVLIETPTGEKIGAYMGQSSIAEVVNNDWVRSPSTFLFSLTAHDDPVRFTSAFDDYYWTMHKTDPDTQGITLGGGHSNGWEISLGTTWDTDEPRRQWGLAYCNLGDNFDRVGYERRHHPYFPTTLGTGSAQFCGASSSSTNYPNMLTNDWDHTNIRVEVYKRQEHSTCADNAKQLPAQCNEEASVALWSDGMPSLASLGSMQCPQCPHGKWIQRTFDVYAGRGTNCADCPAGFECIPDTIDEKMQCLADTYSTASETICTPCPAGSTSAIAASECTCGDGAQHDVNALECAACTPGSAGTGGACNDCAIGTFAASTGSTACTACPGGWVAPSEGTVHCTACPAGKTTDEGVCAACDAGQYAAVDGSASCIACPAYTTASANRTSCTCDYLSQFTDQASAGRFSKVDDDVYEPCRVAAVHDPDSADGVGICSTHFEATVNLVPDAVASTDSASLTLEWNEPHVYEKCSEAADASERDALGRAYEVSICVASDAPLMQVTLETNTATTESTSPDTPGGECAGASTGVYALFNDDEGFRCATFAVDGTSGNHQVTVRRADVVSDVGHPGAIHVFAHLREKKQDDDDSHLAGTWALPRMLTAPSFAETKAKLAASKDSREYTTSEKVALADAYKRGGFTTSTLKTKLKADFDNMRATKTERVRDDRIADEAAFCDVAKRARNRENADMDVVEGCEFFAIKQKLEEVASQTKTDRKAAKRSFRAAWKNRKVRLPRTLFPNGRLDGRTPEDAEDTDVLVLGGVDDDVVADVSTDGESFYCAADTCPIKWTSQNEEAPPMNFTGNVTVDYNVTTEDAVGLTFTCSECTDVRKISLDSDKQTDILGTRMFRLRALGSGEASGEGTTPPPTPQPTAQPTVFTPATTADLQTQANACKLVWNTATTGPCAHVATWDVSQITDMNNVFIGHTDFNGDISGWDVSNVEIMFAMFYNAQAFNQDISGWDVSNVQDMNSMFKFDYSFNQDISGWDVSNVQDMNSMFYNAQAFNQDISGWDVSSVTDMYHMFYEANAFNQDISGWDVHSVTNMNGMFRGATIFNQDISGWDVHSVTNMNGMFRGATIFNQDISTWNVSSVTDMRNMFYEAVSFDIDLSEWDVSSVTKMNGMFYKASTFNQDLSSWGPVLGGALSDPGYAVNSMFSNANAFLNGENCPTTAASFPAPQTGYEWPCMYGWKPETSEALRAQLSSCKPNWGQWTTGICAHVATWDVSQITDMAALFKFDYSFNEDISQWDMSGVTTVEQMFWHARAFNQDISGWDVSSVTNMYHMFYEANAFNQDISGWDVHSVTNMNGMFRGATIFNQDISGWNVASVQYTANIFVGATAFLNGLHCISVQSEWQVSTDEWTCVDACFPRPVDGDGSLETAAPTTPTWQPTLAPTPIPDVTIADIEGGAPWSLSNVHLPVGTYTVGMTDSYGDGWNGATITIHATGDSSTILLGATTLDDGAEDDVEFTVESAVDATIVVTAGEYPSEISWSLSKNT